MSSRRQQDARKNEDEERAGPTRGQLWGCYIVRVKESEESEKEGDARNVGPWQAKVEGTDEGE